ncbi:uncharacterized protein VTP21DRAFT_11175 [Calcarisporiella thermophila]|uniref:uncharacterized protein n=1 Tax=Calcarisporiella thermophila TaxID=911321 RepID=UPI0037420033
MTMNLSLYTIKAVLILDSDGNRVLAKYYGKDYASLKDQKAFERSLFDKTKRSSAEIILFDNHIVLYRNNIDVFFYVIGSFDENELIIASALNTFYEAVSLLLNHQLDKRSILDNLDLVLLALDETVDDGIILETDPNYIVSRVSKPSDTVDIPLSEQTLMQAVQTARERLAGSLIR